MKLGIEVGLDPGHIVLDGDPAASRMGHSTPLFSAHVYCGQTVAHLSYYWALVKILDVTLKWSDYSVSFACNQSNNSVYVSDGGVETRWSNTVLIEYLATAILAETTCLRLLCCTGTEIGRGYVSVVCVRVVCVCVCLFLRTITVELNSNLWGRYWHHMLVLSKVQGDSLTFMVRGRKLFVVLQRAAMLALQALSLVL